MSVIIRLHEGERLVHVSGHVFGIDANSLIEASVRLLITLVLLINVPKLRVNGRFIFGSKPDCLLEQGRELSLVCLKEFNAPIEGE